MYSLSRMAGWYDGRPVASGTTPPKPSALRSSASTKASMTRTGLFSSTQSSRASGNRVVWLRSTPSTKRLIGSPKQCWEIISAAAFLHSQGQDLPIGDIQGSEQGGCPVPDVVMRDTLD